MNKNNFGIWLERKRINDGMTLAEQAKLIGISNTVLCGLAIGARPITDKTLNKIIESYDLKDDEKRDFLTSVITEDEKKRAEVASQLLSKETGVTITPAEHVVWIKYGV